MDLTSIRWFHRSLTWLQALLGRLATTARRWSDGPLWKQRFRRARLWLLQLPERLVASVLNGLRALWHAVRALGRRIWMWRLGPVLFWTAAAGAVLLVLMGLAMSFVVLYPSSQVARSRPGAEIVYLDQGWGPAASSPLRQAFYYTAQGTSLEQMRYAWMVHLEQAGSREKFIAPDHMRALGFFVDNIVTPANPDQLPVGFARHFNRSLNQDVVDITCAACHTGELNYTSNGTPLAIRIDGGQAMHAFTSPAIGQFGLTLVSAMAATLLNPVKFDRFSRNVLGERYAEGHKMQLRLEFATVLYRMLAQAIGDRWRHLYPVEEGFGRTDAIGRISNRVFARELDDSNYLVGNAPVSYPAIWDITKFDWVQYTGSVSQPLARNLGESLGVGADIALADGYQRPLPLEQRFTSSTIIDNLVAIEETVRKLEPPRWPDQILGLIDPVKREAGRKLYSALCARCHEPCVKSIAETKVEMPLKNPPAEPLWHVNLFPVAVVGTDPKAALNFVNHRVNLTKTGLTTEEMRRRIGALLQERQDRMVANGLAKPASGDCEIQQALDGINIQSASIGAGLNYVDILLRERYFKDTRMSKQQEQFYEGFGALDLPQVKLVYKARPLAGVWATAPYLHNGSVPTLYELLLPASQRSKKFFISRLDFDPVRVGLVGQPLDRYGFWFDTSIEGNQNIGHEFRAGYSGEPANGVIGPELTDEQRWDIIEYLKTHVEDPMPCMTYKPAPPLVPCQ